MIRHRSHKPAFTITEILMSLLILVIFFDVAGRVFNSTILLSAAGANMSDDTSRTDAALARLRADVWNSKAIAVSSRYSLDLTTADGQQINWKIDPTEGISRTPQSESPEHWGTIGKDWTLSTDNISLTLAEKSAAPVRLISQILLAQRMHP